ncbi:MAG: hypothetical protein PHN56_02115 [Candidatus Nanoarchaeia archaeon]|nr:hypothetical protein [Candidatus Nanoarchaeia archaeon]
MNSKNMPFIIIFLLIILGTLSWIFNNNIVIELGVISFFILFYYFVIRKELKEDIIKLIEKFERIEKKFENIEQKFEKFEERLESALKKKY